MLLNEVISKVARDLVTAQCTPPNLAVDVVLVPHRDGRLGYEATAVYETGGMAVTRSLNGRHPMSRTERYWHRVFANQLGQLGAGHAARAATLTVFGVDPGAAETTAVPS